MALLPLDDDPVTPLAFRMAYAMCDDCSPDAVVSVSVMPDPVACSARTVPRTVEPLSAVPTWLHPDDELPVLIDTAVLPSLEKTTTSQSPAWCAGSVMGCDVTSLVPVRPVERPTTAGKPAPALGLTDADGLTEADGLMLGDVLGLTLADGLRLALGDWEADGESDDDGDPAAAISQGPMVQAEARAVPVMSLGALVASRLPVPSSAVLASALRSLPVLLPCTNGVVEEKETLCWFDDPGAPDGRSVALFPPDQLPPSMTCENPKAPQLRITQVP